MIRIVEGLGGRDLSDPSDESGDPESGAADDQSGHPESDPGQGPAVVDALSALRTLGFAETEARERTKRAWRRLRERGLGPGREVDASRLITEVLRR